MNRRLSLLAVVGVAILSVCGCQKKEETVNVVTEQPVLGVDESGYAGFDYLSAYTMSGDGEGESVLYLPADENAYVGNTCIISKTEGVETTVNYNPMFSEEVANKSVKQKLEYSLELEYSDIYAEDYEDLEISEIKSVGDDAYSAEVSYLEYDDEKKEYKANWLGYYFVELEDGRTFKVVINVYSDMETSRTEAVIAELESYFEIDMSYESGLLQTKIDSYVPGSDTLTKMNSNTVSFAMYNLFFPEGWEKNNAVDVFITPEMLREAGLNEVSIYSKGKYSTSNPGMIMLAEADSGMSSGEFGVLDKGQEQMFAEYTSEELKKLYVGAEVEVDVIGATDLGYVLKIDVVGWDDANAYLYYIFRAEKCYVVAGIVTEDADSGIQASLMDTLDQIYSTMEVQ